MKSSRPVPLLCRWRLRFPILLLLMLGGTAHAAVTPFPSLPCLEANVAFWGKVYTAFPSSRGLLHDDTDLSRIYAVIDLPPQEEENGRNQQRIRQAKKRLRTILLDLAGGAPVDSPEKKRLLALFGKSPLPSELRAAADRIRFQRCVRDRFREGIVRSGRYIRQMRRIFRQYGLPEDLVYLAHVESSFNYRASSKFGAAGIWQFTRATGRRFLNINRALDERRDPLLATDAAARYLKENFELLGSWPLAITAYNYGEKGMARALAQHGTFEKILTSYDGGRFGFASRNFYAEFLAARRVAKNYARHFGELTLESPVASYSMRLAGFLPVPDVISFFGIDPASLRALNPALRPPVFAGQQYIPEGYRLRLPDSAAIRQLAAAFPERLYRPRQKPSSFYLVRRGDTAGAIARRHKISLKELILANNLDQRARIRIGQLLHIPRQDGATALPVLADSGKRPGGPLPAASRPADREPPAWLAIQRRFTRNGTPMGEIRVAAEETLGHFSDWLKIPVARLRRMNGLPPERAIRTGQTLVVPFSRVSDDIFLASRLEYHQEIEQNFFAAFQVEKIRIYQVKKGDNLWNLCYEKLALPVWLLQKYNQSVRLDALRPHQKLRIPQIAVRGKDLS